MARVVETFVQLKREGRQPSHIDLASDTAAKKRCGPGQAFQHWACFRPPEGHDKGCRIPQIGADPNFGNSDRHTVKTGIMCLSPFKGLCKSVANDFAYAQLPLAA